MAGKNELYEQALKGKKIPVLVLDNRWHQLFAIMEADKQIRKREEELRELLMRQARLKTQTKEVTRLKKKLMDGIVDIMDKEDSFSGRKRDESRRLIEECKEKVEAYEDELLELPSRIDEINRELMLRTMEICYNVMKKNETDILEIEEWLNNIRVELKKNVLRKQHKQLTNQKIYAYMHDVFGPDVIELFDMKYHPGEQSAQALRD